jgi:hypothetical protein
LEATLESGEQYRRKSSEVQKQYGVDSAEWKEVWAKQKAIDAENGRHLDAIIAEFGWPGISVFGEKASRAALLILQHSDFAFQKKYLELARAAAKKGELRASQLALVEDRVRLREVGKQIYGSQMNRNASGEWEPQPIEDEANVDQLRATVGLMPMRAYLEAIVELNGGRISPKWAKKPEAAAVANPPAPTGAATK